MPTKTPNILPLENYLLYNNYGIIFGCYYKIEMHACMATYIYIIMFVHLYKAQSLSCVCMCLHIIIAVDVSSKFRVCI